MSTYVYSKTVSRLSCIMLLNHEIYVLCVCVVCVYIYIHIVILKAPKTCVYANPVTRSNQYTRVQHIFYAYVVGILKKFVFIFCVI